MILRRLQFSSVSPTEEGKVVNNLSEEDKATLQVIFLKKSNKLSSLD